MENPRRLTRTQGPEAMFLGVCGGLAKYFALDPTLIRVLWAVITFVGIGSPILIYLLMALIVPKEQ